MANSPAHKLAAIMPALTGARGLASVWVMIFHGYHNYTLGFGWPNVSSIVPLSLGFLGLDLFFMLSGFVLAHVHNRDFVTYDFMQHVRFLKLRIARIYPLHFFVLASFALPVLFLPHFQEAYTGNRFSFPNFMAALLLLHGWGSEPALWNGPSWSLSAEWLAYLAFPAVAVLINRYVKRGYELLLVLLLLSLLISLAVASEHKDLNATGRLGLLRMATEFVSGCLLYRCVITGQGWTRSRYLFPVALGLIAVSVTRVAWHWGAVFGMALLIPALALPSRAAELTFSNPIFVFWGDISFSLYLCHWPLIQVHNWILRQSKLSLSEPIQAIGLFLLTLGLAISTWKFVEIPARSVLRKYWLEKR